MIRAARKTASVEQIQIMDLNKNTSKKTMSGSITWQY